MVILAQACRDGPFAAKGKVVLFQAAVDNVKVPVFTTSSQQGWILSEQRCNRFRPRMSAYRLVHPLVIEVAPDEFL
jgi:hypothetical protein